MTAVAWTAIGLSVATVLGLLHYLGGKLDALEETINGALDRMEGTITAQIDRHIDPHSARSRRFG